MKKVHIQILCIMPIIIVFVLSGCFLKNESDNKIKVQSEEYTEKFVSELNQNNTFQVKDIFEFNFDCAYVFNDSYISGAGFAKRYDLDINIDAVDSGHQEYMRRIVFVDTDGEFVYEYQYSAFTINAINEGTIIKPDTWIQKTTSDIDNSIAFEFLNAEYYDETEDVFMSELRKTE